MRRKLFVFVMALVAVIFLLDALGVPLKSNELKAYEGMEICLVGKVLEVEDKEDHISLKVRPEYINGIRIDKNPGSKFASKLGFRHSLRDSVLLNYYYKGEAPRAADYHRETISATARLNLPMTRRNPKCFDYRKYLLSEGVRYTSSVKSIEIIGKKTRGFAANDAEIIHFEKNAVDRIEKFLFMKREEFKAYLPDEIRGVIMGVLFGDTSSLDEETYDAFRKNGTAHVLAVSGLHIGILYGLYKKISAKKKNKIYMVLFLFLLFSYGTLSMWSVSTIRAVGMIILIMISEKFALRYDSLSALAFIALVIIIRNPYAVFGAGFQMSFLAIMSIKFMDILIPKFVPDIFRTSLSVTMGLGIYQAYVFNYFAPLSVLVNIPIIFLAGYLVPMALLVFLLFVSLGTVPLVEPITVFLAKLLVRINEFSTLGGHGSFAVPSCSGFTAAFLIISLFFISSETYWILTKTDLAEGEDGGLRNDGRSGKTRMLKASFSLILIVSILFEVFTFSPITHDDIIFIDVGQGDSLHINLGKTDVLIDGGGQQNYNIGKNTLKSYLLKNGNTDVDLAIATHLHMDHYKGLEELCECFKVKSFAKNMVVGNDFFLKKDVYIKTLWPLSIGENMQENNEDCSVFLINFKGFKIITTGDLDETGEKKMIEYYRNSKEGIGILDCDILKIGHHGSKTSTSDEFLSVTTPIYAVFQVGKNMYGHPAPETVEKCQKNGIIVLRNDEKGAIGFSFRRGKIISHQML